MIILQEPNIYILFVFQLFSWISFASFKVKFTKQLRETLLLSFRRTQKLEILVVSAQQSKL